MANTIKFTDTVITLTSIDSDWNWYDTITAYASSKVGVPIQSIQFRPGATDDVCIIYNETIGEARLIDVKAADEYDDKVRYFHGVILKPVLDYSAGKYSANSSIIITLGGGR